MPARAPFPVSDHCDGRRFFFPRDHIDRGWHEVIKWRLTSRAADWPARVDLTPQPPPPAPADGRIAATFVNHATFLLQTPGGNLLTDPVWGERASPFAWSGPRRVHPPGVRLDDLPPIDVVLLSHDHYDHCHLPTLRALARRHQPLLIAPLGHAPITRAREVNGESIYAFRANCSYRHHFESWFTQDAAVPGKIHEMESYHGMLACVSAGAGLALMPRSMLESMPGCATVSVWPLSPRFRFLRTWLVWRRGTVSQSLSSFVKLLEERGAVLAEG